MTNETSSKFSSFEIHVEPLEDEIFFKYGEVYFDSLSAYSDFEGGSLSIVRGNSVIDRTSEIREVGTHAATTCFCGFHNLEGKPTSSLEPNQFEPGDILILEILVPEDFDFVALLRGYESFLNSLKSAFSASQGQAIPFTELASIRDAAKEEAENSDSKIIRFNPK